ncbi:MAG: family 16 glycoside hydrolase [Planctomycetota bacterium]|jgi:hypothetical protein
MTTRVRFAMLCLGPVLAFGCAPKDTREGSPRATDAPAASAEPVALLRDDFSSYERGSDGSPTWTVDSGWWSVTGDGFRGVDCEGDFVAVGARASARSGGNEWTDYKLVLELKVASRGSDWRDGVWIGFRQRDRSNAYTLCFHDRSSVIHKASGGASTGESNPLVQSAATITDDHWHRVEVAVTGPGITVPLDGEEIMEVADESWNASPSLSSGGIVLSARKKADSMGSTQVIFKNVRVESAP